MAKVGRLRSCYYGSGWDCCCCSETPLCYGLWFAKTRYFGRCADLEARIHSATSAYPELMTSFGGSRNVVIVFRVISTDFVSFGPCRSLAGYCWCSLSGSEGLLDRRRHRIEVDESLWDHEDVPHRATAWPTQMTGLHSVTVELTRWAGSKASQSTASNYQLASCTAALGAGTDGTRFVV